MNHSSEEVFLHLFLFNFLSVGVPGHMHSLAEAVMVVVRGRPINPPKHKVLLRLDQKPWQKTLLDVPVSSFW